MRRFILAVLLALASGALGGGFLGYRYAAGRCAADRLDVAEKHVEFAVKSLEAGVRQQHAAVVSTGRATARETALRNRQLEEAKDYEKSLDDDDACRMDADSLRLLNDAIRRVNARIAPAPAD